MAEIALLDLYVSFNSIVLTDHVRAGLFTAEGVQLDASAMGSGWNRVKMGMRSGSFQLEVLDDFAAGSIDATLWAAWIAGVPVPVAARPTSGAISTSNPELQFNVLPSSYSMGGTLGEMAMKNLTFPLDGIPTRDVTP